MTPPSNYRRRPDRPLPPVVPGLSPESLAGLDAATASARSTAADERRAAGERDSAARRLADRVAALPARPVLLPSPTTETARSGPTTPPAPKDTPTTPNASENPATGRAERVIPLRRKAPEPPPLPLTVGDLAVLDRLLAAERARDTATPPPTTSTPSPSTASTHNPRRF